MSKKLTLNKETLRLLASTDAFEAIATDMTAQIVGGKNGSKHQKQPSGKHCENSGFAGICIQLGNSKKAC